MTVELMRDLGEASFPVLLLTIIAVGLRQAWKDFWPWWRDVFWPSREKRSIRQQEQMFELSQSFRRSVDSSMEALIACQASFGARVEVEHQKILGALEALTIEVKSWRSETVNLLVLFSKNSEKGGNENEN